MIIQKHVAEVTFHHSAKGTVHNNPELKRCMYAHLANDAKAIGDDHAGEMTVTAGQWNAAAEKCRNIRGWIPEIILLDPDWKATVDMTYDPSRRTRDEGPPQPLRFTSVDDVKKTMGKSIASAFRKPQQNPAVGGVGGGIGQSAFLRRASFRP